MRKHVLLLLALLLCVLAAPALANAPEIRFSHESGFYGFPLTLTIACSDKKADIYYTTDGTVPDETSLRYGRDIYLDWSSVLEEKLTHIGGTNAAGDFIPETTFPVGHVIRAVAISKDGERSEVISGTYFINVKREELYGDTPVMCLVLDPASLFDYETGIYVLGKTFDEWAAQQTEAFKPREVTANFTQRGKAWEREVSVTYLPFEGEGFTQTMGLRIKGGVSRTYYQKSLRMVAREEYGKKNVKYELFPENVREEDGGIVSKYKSFTLRNGGNDCDYSKMRDPYISRLAAGLNFETADSHPCIAFINGEYWGLYTLTEEYTDNYFQYHYGMDDKNVIIVKCGEIEEGEDEDILLYEELFTTICQKDMSVPKYYERAEKLLDMQSFADYCATHLYICNTDSLFQRNNWQMWRVREVDEAYEKADGKWRMILYDTDISSDLFGSDMEPDVDNITPALNGKYSGHHPARLFSSLMANQEFREMFIMACCDVRNQYFRENRAKQIMDELEPSYLKCMPDTYRRFGPEYHLWGPEKAYKNEAEQVGGFFYERYETFMPILQGAFGLQEPCQVVIDVSDEAKGEVYLNGRSIPVDAGESCLYFPEFSLTVTAVPAEGRRFTGWTVIAGDVTLTEADEATAMLAFQEGFTLMANFE